MIDVIVVALQVFVALCLFSLYYIYDGYLRLLRVLHFLFVTLPGKRRGSAGISAQSSDSFDDVSWPSLTVLITVHNEAARMATRINNVLACDYPAACLQVLIASDGSTDATAAIVRGFAGQGVELHECAAASGKTPAQNSAMADARGEIVVFSDADTQFTKDFLKAIARPFADPEVGACSGEMIPVIVDESGVSTSQSVYWHHEMRVRAMESDLGFLVTATGACCAIRRELFQSMPEHIGDDCVIPRLAALAGKRVVHVSDAKAYDQMQHEVVREFRARVRQTVRNLQGNLYFRELLKPWRYPGVALSIWSHKLLRWSSPLFLLGLTLGCAALSLLGGVWALLFFTLVVFYFTGLLGWYFELRGRQVPLVRTVFSFLLANLGFLFGLFGAYRGRRIRAYR